ncbi:MAG TPA: c-type cytochrome [Marinagarivorans sp.]
MAFKRLITVGALSAAVLMLSACGEDIAVVASDPTPVAPPSGVDIPFDEQKAQAGSQQYDTLCVECHGVNGDGSTGVTNVGGAIRYTDFGTDDAVASSLLANYIGPRMPISPVGVPSDCDTTCADEIQDFFYKYWSEAGGDVTSSSADASSSASSSVEAIPPADRNVRNYTASLDGDLDADSVSRGKALYTEKSCFVCHGEFGGYNGELMEPYGPLNAPIHNNLEYYVYDNTRYETLFDITHDEMPSTDPTACENQCAEDVANYMRSWTAETGEFVLPESSSSAASSVSSSSVASSSSEPVASSSVATSSSAPSGPTQQEIDERVAAGASLYVNNSCMTCHGSDGSSVGISPRALTDFPGSYDEMMVIIRDGVSGSAMPACAPVGDCAMQLTDYIWVEFLGYTLTNDGGVKP